MSRRFEMHILVKNFKDEDAVREAIEREWNITDDWPEDGGVTFMGEGNLVGGEGDDEFARRVRNAIWEANGEYCDVEIKSIYLDDPPTEYFTFGEEDYKKWQAMRGNVTSSKTT
jgi:hypothetical protein